MGAGIARVGDTLSGTCLAHRSPTAWHGTFTTGTGGFTVDGQNAVATGDEGDTSCGHHFRVTGGSTVLTGGGKSIARQGDSVIVIEGGTGSITSGSNVATSE